MVPIENIKNYLLQELGADNIENSDDFNLLLESLKNLSFDDKLNKLIKIMKESNNTILVSNIKNFLFFHAYSGITGYVTEKNLRKIYGFLISNNI
jgi:hypothetical protein